MEHTTHIREIPFSGRGVDCGNVLEFFNDTLPQSNEDEQIMRWLSPIEPVNRHHSVSADRVDGVGGWVLETSEFREWRNGEGGADRTVLFCSGNPGVGKTYLSSLVIDSLCHQAREGDIAVAGLYCDFLVQQEQTVANIMRAILKQLIGNGIIAVYLREEFKRGVIGFGGRRIRLYELMKLVKMAIASLRQVFICIDALDECPLRQLTGFLMSLRDIVQECPRTRVFLTGRPHIRENIKRYFPRAFVMHFTPKTEDIRNYLEKRLHGDNEPEAMDNDLRADIMRIILETMSDTFRLVALNLDSILGEVTIGQRRVKLEHVVRGKGLSDAYTATLERLNAQKGCRTTIGMTVLMWVLYSERPLRAEELCHAVGVGLGSRNLDLDNIPTLQTLVECCLGLVTVEESSSIVRLVHYTLQVHLLRDRTLFQSPHSSIAEVCLTYLNPRCHWDPSPTPESAPPAMPLQEYASCYWGKHARRGMTEKVNELALKLLKRRARQFGLQLLG